MDMRLGKIWVCSVEAKSKEYVHLVFVKKC